MLYNNSSKQIIHAWQRYICVNNNLEKKKYKIND